jgi:hypothetical protein
MRWQYRIITCTLSSGLGDGGYRAECQIVSPDSTERVEIPTGGRTPLTAVVELLNRLGGDGWELVTFDTSTNRGVLKRAVGSDE